MRWKIAVGLGMVLVVLLPGVAPAQTVYADGGTHTVSSMNSGPIQLQGEGTTLNVVFPAVVSASFGVQDSTAIVGLTGTAINMLNGMVSGLQNKSLVGPGITSYGAFAGMGGLVQGGFSGGLGGANGVNLYGTGVIGGGVIQGGPGNDSAGGIGVYLTGSAQVFDGMVRGGTFKGNGTSGTAMVTTAGSDVAVFGGTFQGGVKIGGSAEIGGGTFQTPSPMERSCRTRAQLSQPYPGLTCRSRAGLFRTMGRRALVLCWR